MSPRRRHARSQRGAALLLAMLTLSLVASLASAALWQQWRSAEIEQAARNRQQAAWLLRGALDWGRLILREDARSGAVDHLGEPWAVALAEARLSSFLASTSSERGDPDIAESAFLSGQISDLQARLNLANLIDNGQIAQADLTRFKRLFALRGWPAARLDSLALQLQSAQPGARSDPGSPLPLPPQRLEHLSWLGWPASLVQAMQADVTWLPERTRVNVNTASAAVLAASIEALSLADAQNLVRQRDRSPCTSLAAFNQRLPAGVAPVGPASHDVGSQYFELRGRLRLNHSVIEQASLIQRKGLDTQVLWTGHSTLDTRREPGPN